MAAVRVRGGRAEGSGDGRALKARASADGKILRACVAFFSVLPHLLFPF